MDITIWIVYIVLGIKYVLGEVDFKFVTRVSTGTRHMPVRNSFQCWNLCRKYRDCRVAQFDYRRRICGLNNMGKTGEEIATIGLIGPFVNQHSQTEQPHRACQLGSLQAFQGTGSICLDIPEYLVNIDDWILLFRGTADINKSVYELWMDDTIFHDQPVDPRSIQPGCLTLMTSQHCTEHFRSKLISQWETANIQQVKYIILKEDIIRAEVLFDAVGSNKTNWFTSSRVLDSSWTDLKTSPTNFFSIEGDIGLSRRIFINRNYGGCQVDAGWTTVIDQNYARACPWDDVSSFPRIMFSTQTTATRVLDYDFGDAMVILAKING